MRDWRPFNDVEQAMALAAAEDDRQSYFQLVAVADLFLPQVAGDESVEQRFLTVHAFDQVFLPVFTSVEALAGQLAGAVNGYTITSYAELRRKWPDPDWRLAINPGTPLDAYLSIDSVEEAAVGDVLVPTMAELTAAAEEDEAVEEELQSLHAAGDYPDGDPEAALLAVARAGDVYGYVDRLLDAIVLIPTARPVDAEEILEPGFPWLPGPGQMIEVFTGPGPLARRRTEPVPTVEIALPFALAMWPHGYGLSVNPGGDDGIEIGADEVLWLLSFRSSSRRPDSA